MPCAALQKEKKKDDATPAGIQQQLQSMACESTDPLSQVKQTIQNKIRNMEKRKTKLETYGAILKSGKELTPDQKTAYAQLSSVEFSIETQTEILKNVISIQNEFNKQQKLIKKKEERERKQNTINKLRDLIRYQDVLNSLGDETTRQDFLEGRKGALKSTEDDLDVYDGLFRKLCPYEKDSPDFSKTLDESAQFAYHLLNATPKPVSAEDSTTYSELKEKIDRIAGCAYFEKSKLLGDEETKEPAAVESAPTTTDADVSGVEPNAQIMPSSNKYAAESADSFGSTAGVVACDRAPASPSLYSVSAPQHLGGGGVESILMTSSSPTAIAPPPLSAVAAHSTMMGTVELPPSSALAMPLPSRGFAASDVAATLSFMHDEQTATSNPPVSGTMNFVCAAGVAPQNGLSFMQATPGEEFSSYPFASSQNAMQQMIPDKQQSNFVYQQPQAYANVLNASNAQQAQSVKHLSEPANAYPQQPQPSVPSTVGKQETIPQYHFHNTAGMVEAQSSFQNQTNLINDGDQSHVPSSLQKSSEDMFITQSGRRTGGNGDYRETNNSYKDRNGDGADYQRGGVFRGRRGGGGFRGSRGRGGGGGGRGGSSYGFGYEGDRGRDSASGFRGGRGGGGGYRGGAPRGGFRPANNDDLQQRS